MSLAAQGKWGLGSAGQRDDIEHSVRWGTHLVPKRACHEELSLLNSGGAQCLAETSGMKPSNPLNLRRVHEEQRRQLTRGRSRKQNLCSELECLVHSIQSWAGKSSFFLERWCTQGRGHQASWAERWGEGGGPSSVFVAMPDIGIARK